jgi:hypothetical protein
MLWGVPAQLKEHMININRNFAMYASLVVLILYCLAVASDVKLTADPSVPAAGGKAHLSKDKNSNLKLRIEVYHLAKPGALTPAKQNYVVWTQGRGKDPQNQGVLKVNDSLEGKLENTVPNEDFDVFVTAEDNPTAVTSSEPKLLKGTIQP